ncbi:DUF1320 domain-containing protein [Emcibacter sp.]|uniref:gp436 family protein n=1 Tax=Emcibacter sp. TaxID=1979954 RepID=UPI002AA7E107|nr:DUF1320 domain-containing protein [Emcibacter sp.]
MTIVLTKQPLEKMAYNLPFDLGENATISSVESVDVAPKGKVAAVTALEASGLRTNGAVVQFDLTGGTDGETYLITAIALDNQGNRIQEVAEIRVEDFTWSIPDSQGVLYLTPAEYVTRFGYDETVNLADTYDLGRIDKDRLGARLLEATATVDSYVGKRYITPLAPVPEVIKMITGDLARWLLHGDAMLDSVKDRRNEALRQLKDISLGNAVLSTPVKSSRANSGSPEYSAPPRTFSRDTLGGY